MAATHVLGSSSPVATGASLSVANSNSTTVTVEGLYSALAALTDSQIAAYVPSGYELEKYTLSSGDDGLGSLVISCVAYDSSSSSAAIRSTFRIDMEEVQYDLVDHPDLDSVRYICQMWLATDESSRVDGSTYKYADKNGDLQTISDQDAVKFCAAYLAGIKTFNRYYPVIEQTSVWKNPPGLTRSGRSFTGGSPTFSSDCGTYNTPPLTLSGYAAANWFKSRDSWTENADRTWSRVEQWTYTPESSSGSHAWIYT